MNKAAARTLTSNWLANTASRIGIVPQLVAAPSYPGTTHTLPLHWDLSNKGRITPANLTPRPGKDVTHWVRSTASVPALRTPLGTSDSLKDYVPKGDLARQYMAAVLTALEATPGTVCGAIPCQAHASAVCGTAYALLWNIDQDGSLEVAYVRIDVQGLDDPSEAPSIDKDNLAGRPYKYAAEYTKPLKPYFKKVSIYPRDWTKPETLLEGSEHPDPNRNNWRVRPDAKAWTAALMAAAKAATRPKPVNPNTDAAIEALTGYIKDETPPAKDETPEWLKQEKQPWEE